MNTIIEYECGHSHRVGGRYSSVMPATNFWNRHHSHGRPQKKIQGEAKSNFGRILSSGLGASRSTLVGLSVGRSVGRSVKKMSKVVKKEVLRLSKG